MVPEELRRRISSLRRAGGRPSGTAAGLARRPRAVQRELAECFPEGSVVSTDRGEAFVCDVALSEIHSDAERLTAAYRGAFEDAARLAAEGALPEYLRPLAETEADKAALIDTETAGFHGRPLFMIGLVLCRGGELTVTQYFARTYAEEAAILDRFAGIVGGLDLLISFNGKAFDWPFVRDRMVYHRLSCQARFSHLDLLHPSRRRWRSRLPNCKLHTLERYLCGRWRTGDIPGDRIPQQYHDFVRQGDARLVAPIFHHNRMDLITMIDLLVALVGSEGKALSASARGTASAAARARVGAGGGRWRNGAGDV